MKAVRQTAALLVVLASAAVSAGEVAGLLPPLPTFHEQDAGLIFSNDFLGRASAAAARLTIIGPSRSFSQRDCRTTGLSCSTIAS